MYLPYCQYLTLSNLVHYLSSTYGKYIAKLYMSHGLSGPSYSSSELDGTRQIPFLLWILGPSVHGVVDYISNFHSRKLEFLWELSRNFTRLKEGKGEQNCQEPRTFTLASTRAAKSCFHLLFIALLNKVSTEIRVLFI